MRTKILPLTVVAIILVCLAGVLFFWISEKESPEELKLSDFPEVFKKGTAIVVGENASQIEKESAEVIAANLENLTGNRPKILTIGTESFKYAYNLIIVGTPNSNEVLGGVYNMTDATRVTDEYPGENKGVLEILRNPWNEEKAMLLVGGSDERGVKAGSEILRYAAELDKTEVIVDWEHVVENKRAVVLGLTPSEFEILDTTIHEYLYEKYPFLYDTEFGIRYEKVDTKVEGVPPESLVIDAYANFRTPPVVVRAAFYDENVKIISEKVIEEEA